MLIDTCQEMEDAMSSDREGASYADLIRIESLLVILRQLGHGRFGQQEPG